MGRGKGNSPYIRSKCQNEFEILEWFGSDTDDKDMHGNGCKVFPVWTRLTGFNKTTNDGGMMSEHE